MKKFFKVCISFIKECNSYKWRWNRQKFWLYPILMILLFLFISILFRPLFIFMFIFIPEFYSSLFFDFLFFCYFYYMLYASYIKRLHDLGKSGWWALLIFIPFINIGLLIYCGFFIWNTWKNKYWDDPLKK